MTIRNHFNVLYAIVDITQPLRWHRTCKIIRNKPHFKGIHHRTFIGKRKVENLEFIYLHKNFVFGRWGKTSPRSTGSASSVSSLQKRKYSPQIDGQTLDYSIKNAKRSTVKAANSPILYCVYCTKSDFTSIEQFQSHIQHMHAAFLQEVRKFVKIFPLRRPLLSELFSIFHTDNSNSILTIR